MSKEYRVVLKIRDCTSVEADSVEEAKYIAEEIFRENGYTDYFELEVEEA